MECPVCAESGLEEVVTIESQPAHIATLHRSPESARAVPRARIRLVACRGCGLVWNAAYDPALTDYAGAYDASLHHSPVYAAFLQETADRLAAALPLRDRLALEVGGGGGHFLRLLCARAGCDGLGIDPSGPAGDEQVDGRRITFVRAAFGADQAAAAAASGAALVVARQMLHYFEAPLDFMRTLARVGAPLYVELPNADHVFGTATPWTVFYEHVTYFGQEALRRLMARAGLAVREEGPCYVDGQYLYALAAPAGAPLAADSGAEPDLAPVRAFASRYTEQVAAWRRRVADEAARGTTMVLWGAAGRGTTFLNTVDASRAVAAAVDSNPARHGTFIAGTGHPVVAPLALAEIRPDLVILPNRTYEGEVRRQLAALGLHPEIALA